MIDRFTGEHRFLSNFWPSPLWHDGLNYPTVEHAYQASKSMSVAIRSDIARMSTPGDAKRAGRVLTLREDWEDAKVPIMRQLLFSKFAIPSLRAKLIETGDEELVEGNTWHDNFWGVCQCGSCSGYGRNLLGILLMEVREKVRRK